MLEISQIFLYSIKNSSVRLICAAFLIISDQIHLQFIQFADLCNSLQTWQQFANSHFILLIVHSLLMVLSLIHQLLSAHLIQFVDCSSAHRLHFALLIVFLLLICSLPLKLPFVQRFLICHLLIRSSVSNFPFAYSLIDS